MCGTQSDFTDILKCLLNDCLSKDSPNTRTVYKSQFCRHKWHLQDDIFLCLDSVWRVLHTAILCIIVKNNQFFVVKGKDSPKEILRKEFLNQILRDLKENSLQRLIKLFPASNQKSVCNPRSLPFVRRFFFAFFLNSIPQRYTCTLSATIMKMNENPEVCQRHFHKHVEFILCFLLLKCYCKDLKIWVRTICGVNNPK